MTPTDGVPVTLDRDRVLRFNSAALRRFEQELGLNAYQMLVKMTDNEVPSHTATVGLLWAGLVHEDKKLTLAQVDELYDLTRMAEYIEAVFRALSQAFGHDQRNGKGGKAEGPKAKNRSRGSSSGAAQ